MPKYSRPTGEVFIRAFDQGVMESLGAVVRNMPQPIVGRDRVGYFITDLFNQPSDVQVVFNNPEQIYEVKLYPMYLIKRNDPSPALQRWMGVKSFEYVSGVSGYEETINGVSGFTKVEIKPQAQPYDMFYTITCVARYEHEAIPMLRRIMKAFPQYSKVNVTDSLGEIRTYSVYAESGFQDISEFIDVADRVKGYQLDIRVEGELDIKDPTIQNTVAGIISNTNIIE